MKLLIRNLAKATTEEKLLSLFKEYGSVQSCSLILDKETGVSKGFGFVEMPKSGDAKAAIKHLNGYKLAGNLIRVKKAEAKAATETTIEVTETVKAVVAAVKKEETVEIVEAIDAVTEEAEKIAPSDIWGTIK